MKKHNRKHRQPSVLSARSVDVDALSRELAALPAVPPAARVHTKRDLIEQLREPLREARVDRHYSFTALAEVLRQWGIDIRPDTLRRYLGSVDPNRVVSPRRIPPAVRPPVGEPSPTPVARDPVPNAPRHRAGDRPMRLSGWTPPGRRRPRNRPSSRRAIRRTSGPPIRRWPRPGPSPHGPNGPSTGTNRLPNLQEHAR